RSRWQPCAPSGAARASRANRLRLGGGRLARWGRRRRRGLVAGGRPPLVARLLAPHPVVVPSDLRSRASSHRRCTVAGRYQIAPAALSTVMTRASGHLASLARHIMANPLPGPVAAK